jgi:membrane associated rhomboid family serine protease
MSPWVRRLLIANVAVFVLTMLNPGLRVLLAFRAAELLAMPWTAITYMFVHASFGHILFNMLSLWIFGSRVEERLGGTHFLALYFVSGLAGAFLSFFTPGALIVGASGAVFGVQLAFARYWPRDRIFIWGIIPIEARWLVVLMTLVSIQGARTGGGGIAHFAHLGGYVGAAIYLLLLERLSPARRFRARTTPAAPTIAARVLTDRASMERWSRIDATKLHEVNRDELERIRRRIEQEGVGSLTPADREFLDRFSPGPS